ncbi:hypothetical protein XM79_c11830 [Vibrio vulnificus]|nr:hypothetical protein XM78_c11854 [Vibrio vulnificus]OQK65571.1 hypothetical protein XM79_c11830 [Vibrio vulnificus]
MNSVVPSADGERFRMDPRLREDDKQKIKETGKQETNWEGIECFCLQKACRTTDANSAQIRFHYRATPTIAVILANAGIHLLARTEQCVGVRPYIDKCRESKVNAVVPSTRNARFWDYTRITSKRRKRQAGKIFRTRKSLVRRPHIANIWPTPVGECNVMKHPVKAQSLTMMKQWSKPTFTNE